ncbi:MAG: glycosidase [Candidatus Bathyarchaeia archaeon]
MSRFEGNPILCPKPENPWESRYVFNPAMFKMKGKIHYIYRAMGEDMVSRLGYASSSDGLNIDERLDEPIFEPVNHIEKRGCEDPRVTVMNGRCLMTYTAYGDIPQIGITSIAAGDLEEKRWNWGRRIYPFPSEVNKNAVIFPEKIDGNYVMLHRIDPDIYIAYSKDLENWFNSKVLMRARGGCWDSLKIGAAGPPMEIDEGWLQIYHGVDDEKVYRLGAAILERDNPERVKYRTRDYFIEPEEHYECKGFVNNVVFSCGSVMHKDRVLISYGCADTVIGVSTFTLDEILS